MPEIWLFSSGAMPTYASVEIGMKMWNSDDLNDAQPYHGPKIDKSIDLSHGQHGDGCHEKANGNALVCRQGLGSDYSLAIDSFP
jgi:hypothetical protein